MGHCFGWVGVRWKTFWVDGDEWGWVHCLIMHISLVEAIPFGGSHSL